MVAGGIKHGQLMVGRSLKAGSFARSAAAEKVKTGPSERLLGRGGVGVAVRSAAARRMSRPQVG